MEFTYDSMLLKLTAANGTVVHDSGRLVSVRHDIAREFVNSYLDAWAGTGCTDWAFQQDGTVKVAAAKPEPVDVRLVSNKTNEVTEALWVWGIEASGGLRSMTIGDVQVDMIYKIAGRSYYLVPAGQYWYLREVPPL